MASIKHANTVVGADNPAYENSADEWNADHTTPLTTKGDLLTRDATVLQRLGVGTDTQVLTADSTQATGIKWAAPPGASGGTPAVVLSTAAAAGTATTFLRDDDTIVAFDTTAPVTQAFADAAATGSAAVAARRDHKHGMPAAPSTGASWTQVVNESGASFANFTTLSGTWSSDGTLINATGALVATAHRAKYNTLVDWGFGFIFEAEIRLNTVGASNGQAGLIFGFVGTDTGGGLSVKLDQVASIISIEAESITALRSITQSMSLSTFYKVRAVLAGGLMSVYFNGTLAGSINLFSQASMPSNADFFGLVNYNSTASFRNIKGWVMTGGAPA